MTLATRPILYGLLMAAVAVTIGRAQTRVQQTPPLILESLTGPDSFEFYCAACHGRGGKGDGPVAPALKTRPADLTALARRNGGTFPKERVVSFVTGTARPLSAHGSGEMPIWGLMFRALDPSDERVRVRIENLVAYIELLQVAAPVVAVDSPRVTGAQLFDTYCASCHGANARGNGPAAASLRHQPPDLTKFTARNGGVFPTEQVYRIIDGREVPSHGDREMPIWGNAFRDLRDGRNPEAVKARIAALVAYLEMIQERGAD